MTFLQSPIYCCMLGAIAVQLFEIVKSSKSPTRRKQNYQSIKFYVSAIASIIIAVIVGFIYFDDVHPCNRIVYFHTGASSPLLIRTLSGKLPNATNAGTQKSVHMKE